MVGFARSISYFEYLPSELSHLTRTLCSYTISAIVQAGTVAARSGFDSPWSLGCRFALCLPHWYCRSKRMRSSLGKRPQRDSLKAIRTCLIWNRALRHPQHTALAARTHSRVLVW
jgi:hypothetical protein